MAKKRGDLREVFPVWFALCAAFFLCSACGGDSGASSDPDEEEYSSSVEDGGRDSGRSSSSHRFSYSSRHHSSSSRGSGRDTIADTILNVKSSSYKVSRVFLGDYIAPLFDSRNATTTAQVFDKNATSCKFASASDKGCTFSESGIEATFDKTIQYYHTLEGIPLGWSMDMIVPSDARLAPEKASQVYAGLFLSREGHNISAGAYTKTMDNLVFFEDATQLFSQAAAGWKDNIKMGYGTSKGVEILYEYNHDKMAARIAYTLSKTDRTFPKLNDGIPFPAKFDRRHILNARIEYIISKKESKELGINTFFTYQSGHWATVPAGQFSGWIVPGDEEVIIDYHTTLHNWQTPPYVRWDVGAFWRYGKGTRRPGTLNAGIYNLLNRHNIYSITFDPNDRRWKSLSIFPIMPTISWTMEF